MDGLRTWASGSHQGSRTLLIRETIRLELLETDACRLCMEAETLLRPILKRSRFELHKVDIADDSLLEIEYATRIPVLRRIDTGAELDWPFSQEEVYRFLL